MSDQDHNENLRDLAAMFALQAVIAKCTEDLNEPEVQNRMGLLAYELSDSLMSAKHPPSGIVSVKRRKKNEPS
jgi:hypothetical protein